MKRISLLLTLAGLAIVMSGAALTPQESHLGRCVVVVESAPLFDDNAALLANLKRGTLCLALSRGPELYDDTGAPAEKSDYCSGYHRYRVACDGREGWVRGSDIALETASPLFKDKDREYFRNVGAVDKKDFDIDGDKKSDSLWFVATVMFSQKLHSPEDARWFNDIGASVYPVITLSKSKKSRLVDYFQLSSTDIGATLVEKIWIKDVTGDGMAELVMLTGSYMDGSNRGMIDVFSGVKERAECVFSAVVFNYSKHDWGWYYINRITFGKGSIAITGIEYKPLKEEVHPEFEKGSIYGKDKKLLALPDLPHYGAVCVEMVEELYKWDKKSMKYRRVKYAQSPVYAAVTGSNVNMRDRDGTDGKVIEKLDKGERLKVIRISEYPEEINGIEAHWAYAETAAGKRGWVFSHYLNYEKQVCKEKYTSWGFFDMKDGQVEFR